MKKSEKCLSKKIKKIKIRLKKSQKCLSHCYITGNKSIFIPFSLGNISNLLWHHFPPYDVMSGLNRQRILTIHIFVHFVINHFQFIQVSPDWNVFILIQSLKEDWLSYRRTVIVLPSICLQPFLWTWIIIVNCALRYLLNGHTIM